MILSEKSIGNKTNPLEIDEMIEELNLFYAEFNGESESADYRNSQNASIIYL